MGFPPPLPSDPRYNVDGERVVANWNCPVCGAYTPRTRRPGRPNVYCTNACRQRAYRYRRQHGIRLLRGDRQPTERGLGARVGHLMRPPSDPLSDRRASNRKAVSLCGAFVRPNRDHPALRPDFMYDEASACYTCLALTGTARPDPPMVYPWQNFRKNYTGPPIPPIPADARYAASLRGAPKAWLRQRPQGKHGQPPSHVPSTERRSA